MLNKYCKIIILILCFIQIDIDTFAQAPQKMSYQTIVRNASGALVTNANVGIKISVLQTTASGTVVYAETHTTTTNTNGLASLQIGSGTVVSGVFANINWASGIYFLKSETDPLGGTSYTLSSTTQLLSVPYALYAASSGSSANGWGLNGNSISATDFIGTTNAQPLKFKVNNLPFGILDNDHNGNIGLGQNTLIANTTGVNTVAIGSGSLAANTTGNGNTALGWNSLNANSTGGNNVAVGIENLRNNTGSYNTGVGAYSLKENTSGIENVAVGSNALRYNTTGRYNTALGVNAMNQNTIGYYNTANGNGALFNNTTGDDNTAIGRQALYNNTTGYFNTAMGRDALYSNTIGINNTANGYNALFGNTTGINNTANGYDALYNNTTGIDNIANGSLALYSNTSGYSNTANGRSALYSNTTGYNNTANGRDALYSNITGNNNTANGIKALYSNTSGYSNTANGRDALYSNTTGYRNTANGSSALYSNTTGSQNIASGNLALSANKTGSDNVAIGTDALSSNTTADKNVAIGNSALANTTTGSNNTALGYYAGSSLNPDKFNTTCIGYYAGFANTASNHVNIGNSSVTSIGGQVNWGTYSDKRIKNNIQENVPGLSFITKLKPVTYNLDIKTQYKIANNGKEDDSPNYPGKYDIESIIQTGFLAQDVEQAAKETGYNFSGVEAPNDGKGLYKLRYAEFVVPLVKAVQEQQVTIEDLKKQNVEIKNQNALMQKQIDELKLLILKK